MGSRRWRLSIIIATAMLLQAWPAVVARAQQTDTVHRFDTPLDGLTAASANLLDYWRRGTRSVSEIVLNRSAEEDADTSRAMIDRVARKLGVEATRPLELRDRRVHIALIQALMAEEATDSFSLFKPEDYVSAFETALASRGLSAVPAP